MHDNDNKQWYKTVKLILRRFRTFAKSHYIYDIDKKQFWVYIKAYAEMELEKIENRKKLN